MAERVTRTKFGDEHRDLLIEARKNRASYSKRIGASKNHGDIIGHSDSDTYRQSQNKKKKRGVRVTQQDDSATRDLIFHRSSGPRKRVSPSKISTRERGPKGSGDIITHKGFDNMSLKHRKKVVADRFSHGDIVTHRGPLKHGKKYIGKRQGGKDVVQRGHGKFVTEVTSQPLKKEKMGKKIVKTKVPSLTKEGKRIFTYVRTKSSLYGSSPLPPMH